MILEATDNFKPHKMSKMGTITSPFTVSTSMKCLMNKCDRTYKKARHSGKAVHLTKYKRLGNFTTKHLHVAHDKYVNEVMGGSTPEPLETGPDNAVSNGIKRAWLYLKLLWTESQGILALVSNNHIYTFFRQLQSWGLTWAVWWCVHGRRPQEFTTKAPPTPPPPPRLALCVCLV